MSVEPRQIHIRRFSRKDLSRLLEIERVSFMGVDAWTKLIFRKWHRKCPRLFIVAEISDTIVGYMCTSKEQEAGEIQSIAIDPAFRRQAIASALTNYTIRELQASGITTIGLQVRTTNTGGIRFWRNLGFSPSGILPKFYEDGAEALQMKKSLSL